MAKGEFDIYLCAGVGGYDIFLSIDKSTSLEGVSEKNPDMIRGGFKKMKGKIRKSS